MKAPDDDERGQLLEAAAALRQKRKELEARRRMFVKQGRAEQSAYKQRKREDAEAAPARERAKAAIAAASSVEDRAAAEAELQRLLGESEELQRALKVARSSISKIKEELKLLDSALSATKADAAAATTRAEQHAAAAGGMASFVAAAASTTEGTAAFAGAPARDVSTIGGAVDRADRDTAADLAAAEDSCWRGAAGQWRGPRSSVEHAMERERRLLAATRPPTAAAPRGGGGGGSGGVEWAFAPHAVAGRVNPFDEGFLRGTCGVSDVGLLAEIALVGAEEYPPLWTIAAPAAREARAYFAAPPPHDAVTYCKLTEAYFRSDPFSRVRHWLRALWCDASLWKNWDVDETNEAGVSLLPESSQTMPGIPRLHLLCQRSRFETRSSSVASLHEQFSSTAPAGFVAWLIYKVPHVINPPLTLLVS